MAVAICCQLFYTKYKEIEQSTLFILKKIRVRDKRHMPVHVVDRNFGLCIRALYVLLRNVKWHRMLS